MPNLNTILAAKAPLTLSGVPAGFEPWLLADLARAAKTRAVFVAPDEAAMRAIAATAQTFAPELEVLTFPAWDCLPYDRASPTLRVMAERMATLHRLQATPGGPQLLVTTVNAVAQRTLTPFRIRQLVAKLAPKERIGRDRLAAMLQANGYVRVETVADAGEFAVRGGLVDLFPSGEDHALRLDFFGDEIESVRTFDPADQRTTGRIDGFVLLPASETLIDEDSIKRFRARYRERFGATATGDPLYQAISDGTRAVLLDTARFDFDVSVDGSPPVRRDDNRARAGMPGLAATFEVGPKLNALLGRGPGWKLDLRVPLRAAFTVESRPQSVGWASAPVLNLDLDLRGWNIGLQAGPMLGTRRFHGYFYDVAAAYANSTRPAYAAPGGYAGWGATASASRRLGDWWLAGYVRTDQVGGAAFEPSPLVKQRSNFTVGLAASWIFKVSDERVAAER